MTSAGSALCISTITTASCFYTAFCLWLANPATVAGLCYPETKVISGQESRDKVADRRTNAPYRRAFSTRDKVRPRWHFIFLMVCLLVGVWRDDLGADVAGPTAVFGS